MIPPHPHLANNLRGLCKRTDGSWRMAVDYSKLNQAVTPVTAAVPDVISLPEQINTFVNIWHSPIDLGSFFLL